MPSPLPRLVLTGPESSGKSTLANALAEQLDAVQVEEYLRHYFKKIDRQGKSLTLSDALPIAKGQWQWELDAGKQTHGKALVCDTDLVSSLVYNRHYYGDQQDSQLWQDWQIWADIHLEKLCYPPHAPRLYLLCGIDWPWVEDGQRDAPHLRKAFFDCFCKILITHKLPYMMVKGNLKERLKTVNNYLTMQNNKI